LIFVFIEK